MSRRRSRPSPSSAPPSTSSSHGPRDQSSPRSLAACYARISLWTWRSSSTARLLLDDSVRDVRRHFHVLGELHGEGGAALAHGAHGGRVAEHLRRNHQEVNGQSRNYAMSKEK